MMVDNLLISVYDLDAAGKVFGSYALQMDGHEGIGSGIATVEAENWDLGEEDYHHHLER